MNSLMNKKFDIHWFLKHANTNSSFVFLTVINS